MGLIGRVRHSIIPLFLLTRRIPVTQMGTLLMLGMCGVMYRIVQYLSSPFLTGVRAAVSAFRFLKVVDALVEGDIGKL